ncbi:MAG: PLP-dependent aminotransferase family protein [Nocardioides sp.]|uniref:aminotransferase-like domain-containing protein n=1 Tax=Nocardioides sp. TaxID=35761 RepID=UPI0039E3C9B9
MTSSRPRPPAEGEVRAWIDRRSDVPLYQQVRHFVEQGLRNGHFPLHRPLPSSRYLAQELGVSRNTINAAYLELVGVGALFARPRSGLYPVPGALAARSPDRGAAGTDRESVAAASIATGRGRPDWSDHLLAIEDPWPEHAVIEPDYESFPYPFLPGQIEIRRFPTRAWIRATTAALDGPNATFSLRDSVDRDDPLLVESIRTSLLPAKGISAEADEVLITNGAQQALHLLSEALLDQGRTVAVENPGYVDAARIFRRSGANLRLFSVDGDGVILPDDLDVDLVYVTPSHHHPTNVTLGPERRDLLLARASARDFLIVEDDFDSEVRYVGSPTPAIKAADTDGRVVYLGTFSKFLAPGLRAGFVVAAPSLIAAMRERRFHETKHPSGHLQRTLALFITSGDYHQQLRRHRLELRRKWETLGDALDRYLPGMMSGRPTGGLSYWLTGPDDLDGRLVADLARARGVLVSPGSSYYLSKDAPRNSLRVGFNAIAQARIRPGVARLADAVTEATR